MLSFELCKQLKDAGFEHGKSGNCFGVHLHPLSGKAEIWKECNEFNTSIDYDEFIYIPTLSELIEAVVEKLRILESGDSQFGLITDEDSFGESLGWAAGGTGSCNAPVVVFEEPPQYVGRGKTPEEAVANLWLVLNEKKV